ncbi:MAG TPA: nodulation protein NfeD [Clostridia bacterium]|nr:nodulation protein NfeD [Clostridia bacterium]
MNNKRGRRGKSIFAILCFAFYFVFPVAAAISPAVCAPVVSELSNKPYTFAEPSARLEAQTPEPDDPVQLEASTVVPPIAMLDVSGMITQGTASYLDRGIKSLTERENPVQAVIINLNTPGGLVDATLDILGTFSESPVPVISYVSPSGAIAASAGSFILVGSHIAAMAPGTTTGAAMPIELAPTGERNAADEKTISFLAGHMESIASLRGRPPEIAAAFVTENLTLNSEEALKSKIIDYESSSLGTLLDQINNTEVKMEEETITLVTKGAEIINVPMNFSEDLQNKVSDPQIAFLLLAAGAAALYFGLSTPGTVVLETLGALLLILAVYGMGLFSTSATGIILIVLGLVLIAAELFTAATGVFAVGGAASIILGALLFPQEPLLPGNWYSLFLKTVFGTGIVLALTGILIATAVIRSRRKRYTAKQPLKTGRVVKEINPVGMVKVRGELWRAKAVDNIPISVDTLVTVTERKGLTLLVEPQKQTNKGGK